MAVHPLKHGRSLVSPTDVRSDDGWKSAVLPSMLAVALILVSEPSGRFHHGAVHGLDVCICKPTLATCGADRTLRIWNYTTKMCEQVRYFAEEPLSVALHPNGHHVLVGFMDKLCFFNILLNDVRRPGFNTTAVFSHKSLPESH